MEFSSTIMTKHQNGKHLKYENYNVLNWRVNNLFNKRSMKVLLTLNEICRWCVLLDWCIVEIAFTLPHENLITFAFFSGPQPFNGNVTFDFYHFLRKALVIIWCDITKHFQHFTYVIHFYHQHGKMSAKTDNFWKVSFASVVLLFGESSLEGEWTSEPFLKKLLKTIHFTWQLENLLRRRIVTGYFAKPNWNMFGVNAALFPFATFFSSRCGRIKL